MAALRCDVACSVCPAGVVWAASVMATAARVLAPGAPLEKLSRLNREEHLKKFRQWGSKTPGFHTNFETPGVEVTADGNEASGAYTTGLERRKIPCCRIRSVGCRISSSKGEGRLQSSHVFRRGAYLRTRLCTPVGQLYLGTRRTRYPNRCEAAPTTVSTMAIPPPIHPTYKLLDIIRYALAEDAGDRGDITCYSTIPPDVTAQAQFLAKADGIIAGIELAEMIFREVDRELNVEWEVQDGCTVMNGVRFGSVSGNARSILTAERVVLNFMQRMSGIATSTKKMAEAARPARILDTRKTAPGLRLVDKWAVLIGSGENHRMGLYDMMMVKDNHIDVAGGIKNAIAAADRYIKENSIVVGVEMETRTLEEVEEVLDCIRDNSGKVVTRIMLDNMVKRLPDGGVDVSMLQQAVNLINGVVETEASGNVTLQTVKEIGATGVTYISSGALTHSVEALDISLKVNVQLQKPRTVLKES